MDAVFYPRIYEHEEIFTQEGLHYHLENIDDPITINGVVYNEMKGAFSDPTTILYNKIQEALFPNTAYHFVSGGDPKYIPELSYHVFKDFHSKFYHPSNSYIILYGNLDMEERLEWLDNAYLKDFNRIDFDTRLTFEKPFDKPKYVSYNYPIEKGDDKKDKTFLTYNVVFPSYKDVKLMIATSTLVTALFDVPGAPLREALIDAKIGKDISSYFEDGVLQPCISITAQNASDEDEERFIEIINSELKKIVENGLDKNSLLSLLNHQEFQARERAFNPRTPQGLNVGLSVMSSWLYDDKDCFSYLEVLKYYKELKEDLYNGYFEDNISKYILNNNHKAYVKLIPSDTVNEEKENILKDKLKNFKESLTKEELEGLVEATKKLKEYQSEEDSDSAIATLPKLSLEDINPNPEEFKLEVIDSTPKVLFSDYPTNGIAYVKQYFDISHLESEDLLYAQLFVDTLKQLSTSKMNYKEINQKIQNDLGSLACGITCLKHYETHEAKVYFYTSFSAIEENVRDAFKLLYELLEDTKHTDEKRLFEYLCQLKTNLDMSIVQRGHQVALTRALSCIDEYSLDRDFTLGIANNDFISSLVKDFDTKKDDIMNRLVSMRDKIFSKANMIYGFTGNKELYNHLSLLFNEYYLKHKDKNIYTKVEFKENVKNEAFTAPIDVNYVSRVGKFTDKYNGGLLVLDNAMSLDYLWMQVRVHGGAYGCMMSIDPTGYIGFTSYRDPNNKKTNDVYDASYRFVEEFNPSDEQLLKFKIGATGNSESVKHVRDKADTARSFYLRGLSYSERCKNRSAILSITKEEIKGFSTMFKEAMADYTISCIGNTDKINEVKDMFKEIRTLSK
jgi:Zn-dependent M16 (insulinase) family peptidase